MAYTALNLITDVLLDMGVIADETQPTASQTVGALTKLNDLIESWNIDKLSVYGASEYVLPLVAGQSVYTIGVGGNLNITRPTNITQAFIRDYSSSPANRADYPIPILNNEEYASLPFKSWTGGFPLNGVWFDQKFPLIKAYVNPIPTKNNYRLVFWADDNLGALTQFTVLNLAPGYMRALKPALQLDLSSSYPGIEVPETVLRTYRSAKTAIDRNNLQVNTLALSTDGHYNIYSNRVYTNRS